MANFKIISLTLCLVLLPLLVSVNGQGAVIGDKYYFVYTLDKVNWYRAFELCSKVGMQLASIESETELKNLSSYLYTNSLLFNNYWLSGTNLASKGVYSWASSGNTFSYHKWALNQPGILANRCVRTDVKFEWATDACTAENYFICSKPLVTSCGVTGRCTSDFYYTY
ncbi:C-type lectin mosGCTL-7-like [Cochliomyia hominivorax]